MSIRLRLILFALVSVLLLAVVGGGGWYQMYLLKSGLVSGVEELGKETQALIAVESAHSSFKIQVQEWKNILLRGNDPASFDKYRAAFDKEERRVQEHLGQARALMAELKLDTEDVDELMRNHATLGTNYREALKKYDQKDREAGHVVDSLVKGMDRSASDGMERLVGKIEQDARAKVKLDAEKGEARFEVARNALLVLLTMGIVIAAAVAVKIIRILETDLRLKDTQDKLRKLVMDRESIREEERKHIAWEMHEDLGQLLATMKLRVYGMRTRLPNDDQSLNEDFRAIDSLIDKSIKTTHDIVSGLRPAVLLHGIDAALEWLAAEFNKHPGMICELEIEEYDALVSDELTTLVFRVAQESLEDVALHTGASRVAVTWASDHGSYCLTIRHDGKGDLPEDTSLSFFGLQERVKEFGGEMRKFNTLEHGTVIEARFPESEVA